MKLFKEWLLLEEIFEFDDDSEMIRKKFISPYVKFIVDNQENLSGANIPKFVFSSEIFKSKLLKDAHEKNPITIHIGDRTEGSTSYSPEENKVRVSVSPMVLNLVINDGSILNAVEHVPEKLKKQFLLEFTVPKLMQSFSHEIVHWLDDTFHNNFLGKMLKLTTKLCNEISWGNFSEEQIQKKNEEIYNMITRGLGDETFTEYEINAQIKVISMIKKDVGDEKWDTLTFEEMVELNPGIHLSYNTAKDNGEDMYNYWSRRIKSRMAREGLIGKLMR